MKPSTLPVAPSLLILLLSLPLTLGSTLTPPPPSSPPALRFDFTRDEGCDGSTALTQTLNATNRCAPFSSHGNLGAQVTNVLKRNVRLQLFSDVSCTPSREVFANATLVPGQDTCYAEIEVANSVIVSLA